MTIVKYLKIEGSMARVVVEDKWLVFDKTINEWVVYQKKYNAKKTTVLVSTPDEEKAVSVLHRG